MAPNRSLWEKQKRALLGRAVLRQRRALKAARAVLAETDQQTAQLRRETAVQRRDLQHLHRLLIRLSNSLSHVYSHDLISSRGMKLLLQYYRLRDHWLPVGTWRRKIFSRLIGAVAWDKLGSASPIDLAKLAKRPGLQESLTHDLYHHNRLYLDWILRHEPDEAALQAQRQKKFKHTPLISVIVPAYNTPKIFLQELVASLRRQTYARWELCLAVCGEEREALAKILAPWSRKDRRIKFKLLRKNLGIAGNSNQALTLAKGDYLTFMDHDDLMPAFALFEVVSAINQNPRLEFLYSDEDKVSRDGRQRFDPHFKPDFSPDTLRSYNYICHLSVIRRSLLKKLKGFRPGFEGSQDYDLVLRAADATVHIGHIPKILYHWRAHEASTATSYHIKAYALEAAQKALREHLQRNRIRGTVLGGMLPTTYLVKYPASLSPQVAIIIPTKDLTGVLQKCLASILEKTAYKNYRIYLVDTGSSDRSVFRLYAALAKKHPAIRLLKKPGAFNYSRVNNFAVSHCREKLLLFLNNDMEVINPDWLGNMVEHALRPEVGAVGAKLYYPDDTIQHGGVILGLNGIAGHAHKHFPNYEPGYFFRLKIIQNFSAVTAACLMTRRDVFRRAGGFDEKYQLAFGDVDLCLKIREQKRAVIWTPYAELYHFESKTRGYEDTAEKQMRFKQEQDLFKARWGKELAAGDPFYNPNLTLLHEDFSIQSQRG